MTQSTGQEDGQSPESKARDQNGVRARQALRIVVLDDEAGFRLNLELLLAIEFPNAKILTFNDSFAAVRELMENDPDLFTTDLTHPGVNTREILGMLAKRRVTYPIFVITVYEPEAAKSYLSSFTENLNVAFLTKPYTITELRALLSRFFPLS